MELETPLKRVRALGPAGHGGADWWAMRLNSVALLLLSIWLIVSLLRLPALDRPTLLDWLREPLGAVPMALFIVATFWHMNKGLREIIEDYVHTEPGRVLWLSLLAAFVYGGGALSLFFLARIAFPGAAA